MNKPGESKSFVNKTLYENLLGVVTLEQIESYTESCGKLAIIWLKKVLSVKAYNMDILKFLKTSETRLSKISGIGYKTIQGLLKLQEELKKIIHVEEEVIRRNIAWKEGKKTVSIVISSSLELDMLLDFVPLVNDILSFEYEEDAVMPPHVTYCSNWKAIINQQFKVKSRTFSMADEKQIATLYCDIN